MTDANKTSRVGSAALAGAVVSLLFLSASSWSALESMSHGPRRDFGGPVPIGTEMYKRTGIMASLFGSGKVVADHRVWIIPDNDYSDPVAVTDVNSGEDFYMARADYRKAQVPCNSAKECHAYMEDGDAGMRKWQDHRRAVNSDMDKDLYVFCNGMEMFGGPTLADKRNGTIKVPSSIVSTSSSCGEYGASGFSK